jgi:hypothetical protein
MNTLPARTPWIAAAAAGAVGWIAVTLIDGRREAWDSGLYFGGLFPILGVLVGALAFLAPQRPARIAFASVGGQALVATLQNPTGGLLPLGLILFAMLGAVYLIPARLGVWLRRMRDPGGAW